MRNVCGSLALVCSLGASCGSISVSPLKLIFEKGSSINSLTVENSGRDEALVQVEVLAWTQEDGENKMTATDDVVAVPPVFKLAPGTQQRVRVGLTRAFTEKQEQTFRIMVTEVPTAVVPGTVAVAVRHSMPIFVRTAGTEVPRLTVSRGSATRLAIANAGDQHVRIHRWRLKDSEGNLLDEDAGPGYLLAGTTHSITFANRGAGDPAAFEAETDTRPLILPVNLSTSLPVKPAEK